jgi:hypothetical protein
MDNENIKDEIIVEPYKVYARPNGQNQVIRIFSTCFEGPEEGDIVIKEGNGDEYAHLGYYQLFDERRCHNFKIERDTMIETTEEDKQAELNARPQQTPHQSVEEQILQLQAVVIDMQYQNRLKEMEML